MEYTCKYCNKICKNKNSLAQHEIRCLNNPNHIRLNSNTDLEDLSKEDKKLLSHYTFLYPEEYKNIYYEYKQKYINTGSKTYDACKLAKIQTLKELIRIDEEIQIEDGTWACPICGLHIKDMGTHVKIIHNLNWDYFVTKYNWSGTKIYFSESYRNNLRNNKLNYYNNTEAGLEAKKILSEKFSGENNPACRDDVKLKISKSRIGQHISIKNKQNISKSTTGGLYSENSKSYGYTFWALIGGKEVRFRSKCEYLIYLMFDYYKLKVEHEPYKIEYFDPSVEYIRHYIVDYVYNNRLFEVKPKIEDFTKDIKYNLIQKQLSKINKKLEILTPSNFIEVLNISDDLAKPISFFENLLIENVKNGVCKLTFPIAHDLEFYKNSSFVKKIGGLDIIINGELLYENKKNNWNR